HLAEPHGFETCWRHRFADRPCHRCLTTVAGKIVASVFPFLNRAPCCAFPPACTTRSIQSERTILYRQSLLWPVHSPVHLLIGAWKASDLAKRGSLKDGNVALALRLVEDPNHSLDDICSTH